MSTKFNTILSVFRTQAFESQKRFREIHRGVAALVLCDFYQSISFIGDLLVSPADEYRMVQYRH